MRRYLRQDVLIIKKGKLSYLSFPFLILQASRIIISYGHRSDS